MLYLIIIKNYKLTHIYGVTIGQGNSMLKFIVYKYHFTFKDIPLSAQFFTHSFFSLQQFKTLDFSIYKLNYQAYFFNNISVNVYSYTYHCHFIHYFSTCYTLLGKSVFCYLLTLFLLKKINILTL